MVSEHPQQPSRCWGCVQLLDARCLDSRASLYWHRIVDCLLPVYQALTETRSIPPQRKIFRVHASRSRACVLVQAGVVYPYAARLLPHNMYISTEAMGSQPNCSALLVGLPRVREGVSPVWRLLHRDVERTLGGPPRPSHVVLISRESDSTSAATRSSRLFRNTSHVLNILERVMGLPAVRYTGREDVFSTLRIFGSAAAIVGYHGAGLANAIFVPHHTCVVEISTYMNVSSNTLPWRANEHKRTQAWSPERIHWQSYRIPLAKVYSLTGRCAICG